MTSSINGAGNMANPFAVAFRKPDVTSTAPGDPKEATKPRPTIEQVPINGQLTLAQQVRAGLIESRQLSEAEIASMRPDARNDLEAEIARRVHAQILAQPEVEPGAFLDVKA